MVVKKQRTGEGEKGKDMKEEQSEARDKIKMIKSEKFLKINVYHSHLLDSYSAIINNGIEEWQGKMSTIYQ